MAYLTHYVTKRNACHPLFAMVSSFLGLSQLSPRAKRDFRFELACTVLLSLANLMLIGGMPQLIMIKLFAAPDWMSTLVQAGPFLGNICVIFFTGYLVNHNKIALAAGLGIISAFLLASIYIIPMEGHGGAMWFMCIILVVSLGLNLAENARLAIWRIAFPDTVRNKITALFAWCTFIFVLLGLRPLSTRIETNTWNYQTVYGIAGGLIACGFVLLIARGHWHRFKGSDTKSQAGRNPWRHLKEAFSVIQRDTSYRYYQINQMILGASNLMLNIPRGILINNTFGGALSLSQLATLQMVIPTAVSIVAIFGWAHIGDAIGPLRTRKYSALAFTLSNILFCIGLVTVSYACLVVAMMLWGVAMSSGAVLWRTGHTYFSSKDNDSAYFAIHQGLTGTRGLICGFLGLGLFNLIGPWVGLVGVIGTACAIVGYLKLERYERTHHPERFAYNV